MSAYESPCCPSHEHSTASKVPMQRAYVRVQEGVDSRHWQPIGWYCRFCKVMWPYEASSELAARSARH